MNPEAAEPGIYILHGDDEYSMSQQVRAWHRAMGDPTMAELNTTRLDGKSMDENDLRNATNAMPFLSDRRLVILRNPLAKLGSDAARNRFLRQLEHIAPTTILVLIIDDQIVRKKDWEVLREGHWLRRWAAQAAGHRVTIQEFRLPEAGEMQNWIREEAGRQNGKISLPAANELFRHVGSNTRQAAQEITKLLTYVNFKRPVEPDDVLLLVAQAGQVNIFDMVDALGARNGQRALQLMQALLEEQDPLSILGMVIRQFRLLLLAREVISEGGGPAQIVAKLRQEPFRVSSQFMADKLFTQARRFSIPQLEEIYRRLLALDETLKTSQMDPQTAFAAFIAELVNL
ncbi:MAG TPA: DNA polymerase III subunit delta [Anaerolineaceae bacterium]|nr:DNA polymerase III subunit delta [Anaerolineaceae bacterium]